jgi:hypothetical protein
MMPFPSARLPFRTSLWIAARLMPAVIKRRALDDILLRAKPDARDPAYAELTPDEIIAAVKAVVARPWRMRGRRCLREGLLAFHYLARAGYQPVLHFGIVPASIRAGRPHAHCWVSLGGATILNPPQTPMLDLFAYDGKAAIPASGAQLFVADAS